MAAAELGLTHGAVSRQIKALEAWIGATLFVRERRQMSPTREALRLLAKTRTALEILDDAFGHPVIRKNRTGLIVTTTPAIARFWLIPKMASLPKGLVSSVHTSQNLEDGPRNTPDVRLRYGLGGWAGMQSQLLASESLVPVGHSKFATLIAEGVNLSELPLLGSPFQTWLPFFERASDQQVKDIEIAYEFSDMGLLLDAAVEGLGIVLAPLNLVTGLISRNALERLSETAIDDVYSYYLVWNAESDKRDAINALCDWAVPMFSRTVSPERRE